MAQKLSLNQRPVAKKSAVGSDRPNRLPVAIAASFGAGAVLIFSFTQVARVSPKHGDVAGIVQQIRKERPADATALPSRVDPTRGTKLWNKKHANS
jgi:hypothetical protein